MKGFLTEYCKKHNTTIKELAELSGVSPPRIWEINRGDAKDIRVSNAIALFNATKENFNDPIAPWDLIDFKPHPELVKKFK